MTEDEREKYFRRKEAKAHALTLEMVRRPSLALPAAHSHARTRARTRKPTHRCASSPGPPGCASPRHPCARSATSRSPTSSRQRTCCSFASSTQSPATKTWNSSFRGSARSPGGRHASALCKKPLQEAPRQVHGWLKPTLDPRPQQHARNAHGSQCTSDPGLQNGRLAVLRVHRIREPKGLRGRYVYWPPRARSILTALGA